MLDNDYILGTIQYHPFILSESDNFLFFTFPSLFFDSRHFPLPCLLKKEGQS